MKIKITLSAQFCNYSFFCWDKQTKQDSEEYEELKELINKFIDASDEEEREEIVSDILEYGDNESAIGYIEGIEVEYPGEEYPDETHAEEIDGFRLKEIDDFFGSKMDLDLCDFYICKEEYSKKGYLVLETESDKPFNINYLSMNGDVITYGMDELEWEDYGRGYDSSFYIRVSDKYEIKERVLTDEEIDAQEKEEELRQTQENIAEYRDKRIVDLYKQEQDAYDEAFAKSRKEEDESYFKFWKSLGSKDKGEKCWDDFNYGEEYKYVKYDEDKLEWHEKKGKTSDPKYLKLLEKKKLKDRWEEGKSKIRQEFLDQSEGLKNPRYSEFRRMLEEATNLEIVKSWDDSIKEVVADYDRRYEEVEIWQKNEEQNYWVSMGYPTLTYGGEKVASVKDAYDVPSIKQYLLDNGYEDVSSEYVPIPGKEDCYYDVKSEGYEEFERRKEEMNKVKGKIQRELYYRQEAIKDEFRLTVLQQEETFSDDDEFEDLRRHRMWLIITDESDKRDKYKEQFQMDQEKIRLDYMRDFVDIHPWTESSYLIDEFRDKRDEHWDRWSDEPVNEKAKKWIDLLTKLSKKQKEISLKFSKKESPYPFVTMRDDAVKKFYMWETDIKTIKGWDDSILKEIYKYHQKFADINNQYQTSAMEKFISAGFRPLSTYEDGEGKDQYIKVDCWENVDILNSIKEYLIRNGLDEDSDEFDDQWDSLNRDLDPYHGGEQILPPMKERNDQRRSMGIMDAKDKDY
ncbi:hypothetical protein SynA18461_01918 [Synechococcus sp. A18-46.1]|nr:hypothetical protein SynA18461_01918 [Synechococcus sp. A18-46.1]